MDEYVNLKILGRGSKGELTKKVRSKIDQNLYVIKELGQNKLTKKQKDVLNILVENECPYIVKHYLSENNETEIKTDYINDVDLLDYTNTFMDLEKPIEEKTIWKLLTQCSRAIKYLHEKKIIHRNIRLENFYMTDNKDIKLGNFKYATIISDNNEDEDDNFPEGGILYKNLKALNNSIYDQRSDIYSLGVVFYKMCFFQFPNEPISKQSNNGVFELNPFPDNTKQNLDYYSNDLIDLIKKMLNQNEEQLEIKTIYEKSLNIYKQKYIKNSSIKSAFACISTFGGYRDGPIRNKMASSPLLTNFFHCTDYTQERPDRKQNLYNESINFFRHKIEENYTLKIDEEPRPIDVVQNFFDLYIKYLQESKHEKLNNIYDLYYGRLLMTSTLNNIKDEKLIFNFLKINIDKCQKDENTGKYNILQLIQDSLKPGNENAEIKYIYNYYPEYMIIVLDKDKNINEKMSISMPPEITILEKDKNKKYLLSGYLNRKIEKDGTEIFNSVYSIRKDGNFIWKLLENDSIKDLNNYEWNDLYGFPEILFYKLKREKKKYY